MKSIKNIAFLLLLSIVCGGWNLTNYAAMGTQEVSFTIPHTNRVLTAEIYYPVNLKISSQTVDHFIWRRQAFIKGAPLSARAGLYPLVIFSHGK